jgi:aminomethyltransferase
MDRTMLQTSLHQWHIDHGGRMVEFGGWSMPVQYSSIIAEHQATRTALGIFDVSHMGRFWFSGARIDEILDGLLTRRVKGLEPEKIRYSLMCREDGGILDDVLFYHLGKAAPGQEFMMVVNASNRQKIFEWITAKTAGSGLVVDDRTTQTAMIAVQGPIACATVKQLSDTDPAELAYYTGRCGTVCGKWGVISRTGYTGEDGCELIVEAGDAAAIADAIIEKSSAMGGMPAGLGARDTLRLEAAMPLYGHELGESINAAQTGLKFAINLKNRDFIGSAAIASAMKDSQLPVRVGLQLEGRRAARETCEVHSESGKIGVVTSGTFSPTLNQAISMAYVAPDQATNGTAVSVDIRGSRVPAKVVDLPFYSRG